LLWLKEKQRECPVIKQCLERRWWGRISQQF